MVTARGFLPVGIDAACAAATVHAEPLAAAVDDADVAFVDFAEVVVEAALADATVEAGALPAVAALDVLPTEAVAAVGDAVIDAPLEVLAHPTMSATASIGAMTNRLWRVAPLVCERFMSDAFRRRLSEAQLVWQTMTRPPGKTLEALSAFAPT